MRSNSRFHPNSTMIYRYLILAGVILGASPLYSIPRANAQSHATIVFTGYVSPGCRMGNQDDNTNPDGLNVNCNTGAQISVTPLDTNGVALEEEIDRLATNGSSQQMVALNFPAAAQRKIGKLSTKYHPTTSTDVDRAIVTVVPY
jgi:hypothetical protein